MAHERLKALARELVGASGHRVLHTDREEVLIECRAALESSLVKPRQHPLGFLITDLESLVSEEDRQGQLRLHIWPVDYETRGDGRGTIHTHTWDLRSAVLFGAIRNTTYRVVEGEDAGGIVSEVVYSTSGTRFLPVHAGVSIQVAASEIIRAGEYYCEDTAAFHASEVVASPAITLVLAVPARETALVYSDSMADSYQREFVRVEAGVSEALNILLQATSGSS
jgi:hypothetical protein